MTSWNIPVTSWKEDCKPLQKPQINNLRKKVRRRQPWTSLVHVLLIDASLSILFKSFMSKFLQSLDKQNFCYIHPSGGKRDNLEGWNSKVFLAHLKYQQPWLGNRKQSFLDIVIAVDLHDAISDSNNNIWFFFYICLAGTKCLGEGMKQQLRICTCIYLFICWKTQLRSWGCTTH